MAARAVEVLRKPLEVPDVVEIVLLFVAVAAAAGICYLIHLSPLAIGIVALTIVGLYFIGKLAIPSEYRGIYFFLMLAIGLILVGLIQKGVIPLDVASRLFIMTYNASLLELTIVNVLIWLWAIGATIAFVIFLMSQRKGAARRMQRGKPVLRYA